MERVHNMTRENGSSTATYRCGTRNQGTVPKNQYGSVDLFQPSMLPAGTTHLTGASEAPARVPFGTTPPPSGLTGSGGVGRWGALAVTSQFRAWAASLATLGSTLPRLWYAHRPRSPRRRPLDAATDPCPRPTPGARREDPRPALSFVVAAPSRSAPVLSCAPSLLRR